jgi:hypothetical protein
LEGTVFLLECVLDVLEEDEAEDNVLALCSFEVAVELVGGDPKGSPKPRCGLFPAFALLEWLRVFKNSQAA